MNTVFSGLHKADKRDKQDADFLHFGKFIIGQGRSGDLEQVFVN